LPIVPPKDFALSALTVSSLTSPGGRGCSAASPFGQLDPNYNPNYDYD